VNRTDLTVIGLGYVGLPLALEAVRSGLTVQGYDYSSKVVTSLNQGHSHVDDINDTTVQEMRSRGFEATSHAGVLNDPKTIVICVPTPLSPDGGPDLTAVRGAAQVAAKWIRPGALVVLESTSYPGTTEEVVLPILEEGSGLKAGTDFHLAFSPERIDPGNKIHRLRNTPKIVGGHTPACTKVAVAFYSRICDTVVEAKGMREAEMAKLLENTYRHVNIALVNEMAIFCREMGIDLEDAIRCAATKPFGFHAFHPGPGVGGHCIPIDPNYLSHKVLTTTGHPFRFVELAQDINAGMPAYVAERAGDMLNDAYKSLRGSVVLLLGVTYKADIADQRETPASDVVRKLRLKGARVVYHDPYVDGFQVDSLPVEQVSSLDTGLVKADLTILLQKHGAYDLRHIADWTGLLLDTTGHVTGDNVEGL
jgi:nucleotide sugar dehydrogenase